MSVHMIHWLFSVESNGPTAVDSTGFLIPQVFVCDAEINVFSVSQPLLFQRLSLGKMLYLVQCTLAI